MSQKGCQQAYGEDLLIVLNGIEIRKNFPYVGEHEHF